MMKPVLALSAVALSLTACTDDPISYSDAVGISFKADVEGGVVSDEKNINTESGNPYAAFIADARNTLGADPGAIEVDAVELALAAGSSVIGLDQVFGGDVEVLFQINDTNTTYVVATGTVLPGITGPLALDIAFASEIVDAADYGKLVGGGFKVITRGPAAPGFDGKSATANLQVTFTFAAFTDAE